jgi:hypothetical protein
MQAPYLEKLAAEVSVSCMTNWFLHNISTDVEAETVFGHRCNSLLRLTFIFTVDLDQQH